MTVKFIKVTKKDRVCYAPVPEPVEQGDKLEIMEMKEGSFSPPAGKVPAVSLSRNPMVFVKMNDGFQRILMKHILYVEAAGSYCTLHVHGMSPPRWRGWPNTWTGNISSACIVPIWLINCT